MKITSILSFLVSCSLLTGFFDSSNDVHFNQGGTLVCEVKRGFFFGGNYTVKVNKRNASEDTEYTAHGQSTRVYRLDDGKTVEKSSCRVE